VNPDDVLSVVTGLPAVLLVAGPGAGQVGYRVYAQNCGTRGVVVSSLTVDAVRDIQMQAYRAVPASERFRAFLVSLDGASEQALNALLKVLEEPPDSARFILTATRPVLDTIVSRCHVIVLGSQAHGVAEMDARVRGAVSAAVKAARTGQPARLSPAMRGWDGSCTTALGVWAAEAVSGRWRVFEPGFAPGVTTEQAFQVLTVLRTYQGARTAAAVALRRAFAPG
jgi:hypothetical protein